MNFVTDVFNLHMRLVIGASQQYSALLPVTVTIAIAIPVLIPNMPRQTPAEYEGIRKKEKKKAS